LGLALDPKYVEGFVEGCLERIGEDHPEDEAVFRDLWKDEAERESVLTIRQRLKQELFSIGIVTKRFGKGRTGRELWGRPRRGHYPLDQRGDSQEERWTEE
jgi:hypothetical protein